MLAFSNTEIKNFDLPIGSNPHVGRLQVTVNNAVLMQIGYGAGNLPQ